MPIGFCKYYIANMGTFVGFGGCLHRSCRLCLVRMPGVCVFDVDVGLPELGFALGVALGFVFQYHNSY